MSILESFSLNGKVAIVTGSSKGLGQGIAAGLAEAGADIVGVARSSQDETKKLVEGVGRRFLPISYDLSDQEHLKEIIDKAVEEFGHIDILVNNAGIIRRQPALEFSEENWDDVINVNLRTPFFLSQLFANQVVKQKTKGKIINIASMLSYQGGILVSSYTASKHGIAGITRILANEWAKYGINVNAIAPGYMATDNTLPLQKDPVRNKEILARIPVGRWGSPDDLKGIAVFLASSASDYMTGTIVPVDGGWLSR